MRRLPYVGQQLPVFSPLSSVALAQSTAALLRSDHSAHNRLRSLIGDRFAADDVILFDSGRSALQTAIRVAGAQGSSRNAITVALPAFQCFEVATAAIGSGARICFYDIEPETLGPDLASLERALQDGANVVVVAPLYGIPVDWDAICSLVDRHDAIAIEDAAQGIGASWRGRRLGTLGRLSVLSFGRGKGWTGGGGGALCIRGVPEASLAISSRPQHSAEEWRVASSSWAQWVAGRPAFYGVPARLPWLRLGETQYREPTTEGRMPRFSAELLMRTVSAADREVEVMRARGDNWRRSLEGYNGVHPISQNTRARPGYLRFPVRAVTPAARRFMRGAVAVRLGVARSYPLPLNRLPAVVTMKRGVEECPGAQSLAEELFTLPTHSLVTASDRDAIVRLLSLSESFGKLYAVGDRNGPRL